jgi:NADH-quinone oxidoreductase subunit C
MDAASLLAAVLALDADVRPKEKADRPAVTVPRAKLSRLMLRLRNHPQLAFDMLCAHTAVDWPAENRIELFYYLYSTSHRHYALVCADVPRERPEIETVSTVWRIAEWQEREVYDMFGVLYASHPDLRRLLLSDDWEGFPLRKDYKDDFMLEKPA